MTRNQKIQYKIKVSIDKLFSFLILILLLPLLIMISIFIRVDSKGPVIFKQKRLGKNGNTFYIYKFRTMCDNAVNIGSGIFITKNDKRITRIGNILRKTSLDELPQLINILKGDMSFVGPRPPLVNHPMKYHEYDERQVLRFQILPGITGNAQAYGRNSLKWPERIKMDVSYYENFSLFFDLKIILATVITVSFSRGTYSNRQNSEKN